MTDEDGYLDYIQPRGLPVLKATLRVIVAVQCLGVAAQSLSRGMESGIAWFLSQEFQWSEAQTAQFDTYAAYALIASAVLTLLRPCWPVLLPVFGWFLADPVISLTYERGAYPILEPCEQAARYGAVLALLILDFWPPRLKSHLGRTTVSMWLLRLAAAATFVGHGLVALSQSTSGGHFVVLLTDAVRAVFETDLTEDRARWLLALIGGIDLGVALNLVVSPLSPDRPVYGAVGVRDGRDTSRLARSGSLPGSLDPHRQRGRSAGHSALLVSVNQAVAGGDCESELTNRVRRRNVADWLFRITLVLFLVGGAAVHYRKRPCR